MVTICTTRFKIKLISILPTECIYVFHTILTINGDSKQQYLIGFVREMKCVFCKAGTEVLNIIYITSCLNGLTRKILWLLQVIENWKRK
jgi:hypothetical protein